jgi:hypothetical protein
MALLHELLVFKITLICRVSVLALHSPDLGKCSGQPGFLASFGMFEATDKQPRSGFRSSHRVFRQLMAHILVTSRMLCYSYKSILRGHYLGSEEYSGVVLLSKAIRM